MFDNSDLLELLIIAAVAALLVYKFFITLGERRGFERAPTPNTLFEEPAREKVVTPQQSLEDNLQLVSQRFRDVLEHVHRIDPQFSLRSFLEGAAIAFEMILTAYAKGEHETLQQLLSTQVFADFASAIEERHRKGYTLSTTLIKLDPIDIETMTVEDATLTITVKYTSEQTNILYDHDKNILEGSPNQIEEVVDIWTFQRDLRSPNPNWTLVATGS
jgi:predicted lipid-binding transport protein (Tim44 family)